MSHLFGNVNCSSSKNVSLVWRWMSNLTPWCLCTCVPSQCPTSTLLLKNGNPNRNSETKIGMSNSTPRTLCTCPFSSNLSTHSDDPSDADAEADDPTDADAGVYLRAPIPYSFPPLLHHSHFYVERSYPDADVPFPRLFFLFILILISSLYFSSFSWTSWFEIKIRRLSCSFLMW